MMTVIVGCRRSIAFALLVSLAACTSWRPYQLTATGPTALPSKVRVTLVSHEEILLRDAFVMEDTLLYGYVDREGSLRAVPASSIASIEAQFSSAGKTVALVAGAAFLLVVGPVLLVLIGCGVGDCG